LNPCRGGANANQGFRGNEMLKSGQNVLIPALSKLFNLIFVTGTYPPTWATARVIAFHKKGNAMDPNNNMEHCNIEQPGKSPELHTKHQIVQFL
jgi:hypothetical protein